MKQLWIAAAFALTLTGVCAAQQTAAPQPAQQQQQIPDAPKPQLPGIGNVAPGKGTTPTDNGLGSSSAAAAQAGEMEQTNVPSSLPSAKLEPDSPDQPIVPDTGKYSDIFKLPTLRVNYVEIPFTVKDSKGHLVPGIQPREIHVYENNVRQKMQVFTVDPFPLTVAVVIDQSLPYEVMTQVNNAIGNLPNAFAAYDDVAVFTYNNGPRQQTEFTSGTSPRLAAVIERAKTSGREQKDFATGALAAGIDINAGAEHQMTPLDGSHNVGSPIGVDQVQRDVHTLNDAIMAAAQAVAKEARGQLGRRRIVYVISDGKEYGSKVKQKELIKFLQENKIQVYATVVGDSSLAGLGFVSHLHLPLMMKDNILQVYTKATGGECYADYRTKNIEASFAKITEEERTQYTVGYNTHEPFIDGKFRKVDVRVLRPNLEIIAKEGYYPSAEDAAGLGTSRPPTSQPTASAPATPGAGSATPAKPPAQP